MVNQITDDHLELILRHGWIRFEKDCFGSPFNFTAISPPTFFSRKWLIGVFSWRQAATNIATANCHQRISSRNIAHVRASTCTTIKGPKSTQLAAQPKRLIKACLESSPTRNVIKDCATYIVITHRQACIVIKHCPTNIFLTSPDLHRHRRLTNQLPNQKLSSKGAQLRGPSNTAEVWLSLKLA